MYAATIRDRIAPKCAAASWKYLMREIILTALVWICVALPASITLAASPAPDTILFNGKIFTAEGNRLLRRLQYKEIASGQLAIRNRFTSWLVP
jgi:hypothetical protein